MHSGPNAHVLFDLQIGNFDERNKKTQNLAKHIEDLINYKTLMKIAFRGGGVVCCNLSSHI